MTTFTKVWALKSDRMVEPGAEIEVSLKRGGTKKVTVGTFLGKQGDKFLFTSTQDFD
jgi:hypothetical protein